MGKSKWNKWKLIHKETGLTFKQHYKKHGIKENTGYFWRQERAKIGGEVKLIPVLLDSGIPAVYVDEEYYPTMFFLNNKEWEVEMKNAEQTIDE